jgi:hypothetical protein
MAFGRGGGGCVRDSGAEASERVMKGMTLAERAVRSVDIVANSNVDQVIRYFLKRRL